MVSKTFDGTYQEMAHTRRYFVTHFVMQNCWDINTYIIEHWSSCFLSCNACIQTDIHSDFNFVKHLFCAQINVYLSNSNYHTVVLGTNVLQINSIYKLHPCVLFSFLTNLKFNFYTRPCGTMQEIELAAVQFYLSE